MQLHFHPSGHFLAFGTDTGGVGVLDVKFKQATTMKTRHTNVSKQLCRLASGLTLAQICSAVKFIPDRPNELVSGGYDSALLHFDFKQGTLLSRFDIGRTGNKSTNIHCHLTRADSRSRGTS